VVIPCFNSPFFLPNTVTFLVSRTGRVLLQERGKESCQRHLGSLISVSMCVKVWMKRGISDRGYGINVVLIWSF